MMNVPIGNPDHSLSDEEREVIDQLTKAWNMFTKLPVQHPMHSQEFCFGIHMCQRLIMSRPTARREGWVESRMENYQE